MCHVHGQRFVHIIVIYQPIAPIYSKVDHSQRSSPAKQPFMIWVNALQWRHNEHDTVSNRRRSDCMLNVWSSATEWRHQSSASLAFEWGIHRQPEDFPHREPVTPKMFTFEDIIMKNKHVNIIRTEQTTETSILMSYIVTPKSIWSQILRTGELLRPQVLTKPALNSGLANWLKICKYIWWHYSSLHVFYSTTL